VLLQHEMSDRLQRFPGHFRLALAVIAQQRNDRVVGFGVSILIDVYPMTLDTCSSSSSSSLLQQLLESTQSNEAM